MPTITHINIYPIKSLGGISVSSARVTDRGLEFDRRWMLIDENNRFLSQRELPMMALLGTEITNNHLKVYHRNNPSISLQFPLNLRGSKMISATIWDDECSTVHISEECDSWFSEALKEKCRLVYMDEDSKRWINHKYAHNKLNNFSDEFPISIISEQSLNLLNSKLLSPIKMNRFRPNIIIESIYPHQEDELKSFTINDIQFEAAKSIARCLITTIDQTTSIKGKEPLTTLASYRSENNKIYFGKNVLATGRGIINVGDQLI